MEANVQESKIGAGEIIAFLLLGAGLWECAAGWLQLLGFMPSLHSRFPATGTFYNPGPYCGFLAMIMPVALYCALGSGWRLLKWTAMAYLIPAVAIMPVLMGRTGWVAAAAGCLLVGIGRGKISRPGRKVLPWVIAFAACAAVILFYLKPASALGRLFLWRTGLSALTVSPLTGVGWSRVAGALGDAQEAYFHARPDSAFAAVAGSPDSAFNEFLQIGIAFGIPAMLLFIAVIACAAAVAWRGRAYGVAGGIVSFAIVCLASYPLRFAEFVAVAGLMVAGAVVAAPRWRLSVKVASVLLIGGLTAFACIRQAESRALAGSDAAARYVSRHRLVPRTVSRLDSLSEIYAESAGFLFDYGKALRQSGMYDRSSEILLRGMAVSSDPMFLNLLGRNCHDTGEYDRAEHYYRRSIDRLPGRMYPYYLLARLYADPAVGDSARFMSVCEAVASMDPKVMSPAIRQMRAELAAMRDSIAAGQREDLAEVK